MATISIQANRVRREHSHGKTQYIPGVNGIMTVEILFIYYQIVQQFSLSRLIMHPVDHVLSSRLMIREINTLKTSFAIYALYYLRYKKIL